MCDECIQILFKSKIVSIQRRLRVRLCENANSAPLHIILSHRISPHHITSHHQPTFMHTAHTHSRTHRRLLNTKDNAPAKQAPLNGIKTEINYHFDWLLFILLIFSVKRWSLLRPRLNAWNVERRGHTAHSLIKWEKFVIFWAANAINRSNWILKQNRGVLENDYFFGNKIQLPLIFQWNDKFSKNVTYVLTT